MCCVPPPAQQSHSLSGGGDRQEPVLLPLRPLGREDTLDMGSVLKRSPYPKDHT